MFENNMFLLQSGMVDLFTSIAIGVSEPAVVAIEPFESLWAPVLWDHVAENRDWYWNNIGAAENLHACML